jgi:hypothetical protein
MSLFGILFGITMLFLIGKALIETLWGIGLIIHGIFCHLLALILDGCAISLRLLIRLNKAASW